MTRKPKHITIQSASNLTDNWDRVAIVSEGKRILIDWHSNDLKISVWDHENKNHNVELATVKFTHKEPMKPISESFWL